MFSNFAWSEMLVIACVAIIVVGPKDLPGMLRTFGKTLGSLKRMAGDFQRQVSDALKEADMDDLKDLTSSKGFGPLEDARKTMEDYAQSMKDTVGTEPSKNSTDEAPQDAKANGSGGDKEVAQGQAQEEADPGQVADDHAGAVATAKRDDAVGDGSSDNKPPKAKTKAKTKSKAKGVEAS